MTGHLQAAGSSTSQLQRISDSRGRGEDVAGTDADGGLIAIDLTGSGWWQQIRARFEQMRGETVRVCVDDFFWRVIRRVLLQAW